MQILVIVANSKLRMFWAKVDKGSVRTVFGYGLGGPKPWVNILYKGTRPLWAKGKQVKIPVLEGGYKFSGNARDQRDDL